MNKLKDIILEHLVALDDNFRYYFNEMIENAKQYDSLRNPFLCEESVVSHLPFSAQKQFVELQCDRTLEMKFNNQTLIDFLRFSAKLKISCCNFHPPIFAKPRLQQWLISKRRIVTG